MYRHDVTVLSSNLTIPMYYFTNVIILILIGIYILYRDRYEMTDAPWTRFAKYLVSLPVTIGCIVLVAWGMWVAFDGRDRLMEGEYVCTSVCMSVCAYGPNLKVIDSN